VTGTAPPDPSKPGLPIVADEPSVLVGMQRYFQAAGFQVDCALEREEAG